MILVLEGCYIYFDTLSRDAKGNMLLYHGGQEIGSVSWKYKLKFVDKFLGIGKRYKLVRRNNNDN